MRRGFRRQGRGCRDQHPRRRGRIEWAQTNLPADLPVHRRADGINAGGQILIEGNKAAAFGVLFGGANVLTWYPITPSSSLAEYAEEFLKKHRNPARWQAGRSP